jgi:hypothetical protein
MELKNSLLCWLQCASESYLEPDEFNPDHHVHSSNDENIIFAKKLRRLYSGNACDHSIGNFFVLSAWQ